MDSVLTMCVVATAVCTVGRSPQHDPHQPLVRLLDPYAPAHSRAHMGVACMRVPFPTKHPSTGGVQNEVDAKRTLHGSPKSPPQNPSGVQPGMDAARIVGKMELGGWWSLAVFRWRTCEHGRRMDSPTPLPPNVFRCQTEWFPAPTQIHVAYTPTWTPLEHVPTDPSTEAYRAPYRIPTEAYRAPHRIPTDAYRAPRRIPTEAYRAH